MGDTANLDTWFGVLGISGATYKIIDGRVGTVNGSTLTTTNWGKTQVTAEDANGNFRVIILEVRPKGAVAMPMVTGGIGFILALRTDGTIWTWGDNSHGQLGRLHGTAYTPNCVTKQDYTTLTNVIQIAAGSYHAIALDINGVVWSWGYNAHGELGNGRINNPTNVFYAAQVVTGRQYDTSGYLQNIVSIAAGAYTSYAVTTTGEALAWGNGASWALGINSTANTANPRYVNGQATGNNILQNVLAIESAMSATLFLLSNGTVFTTGINNQWGGLGNGTTNNYLYPVQVVAGQSAAGGYLTNIIEIATTGFVDYNDIHTFLALKSTGEIYSWGCSYYYTTGLGNTTDRSTPTKITSLSGQTVIHIAAAVDHIGSKGRNTSALAITADGKTYTWGGKEGYYGHLGNANASKIHTTPQLTSPTAFDLITVSGGSLNYIGVKADGSVFGWGSNSAAQINGESTADSPYVYSIGGWGQTALRLYDTNGGKIASTITLAENEKLQIDTARSARILTVGLNLIHDNDEMPVQTPISFSSTDTSIVTVDPDTGIITPNTNNRYGEATIIARDADGVTGMIRVRIKPKNKLAMPMVAAGIGFTLALKSNGTVWSWGLNSYGQLGRVNRNPYLPGYVMNQDGSALSNITQITAGGYTGYALDQNGCVWSWGYNGHGELGIGTLVGPSYRAVQVVTGEQYHASGYLQNIISIAAGTDTGYAITEDGKALAWGYGSSWALGTGRTSNAPYPTYVSGKMIGQSALKNVLAIDSAISATIFLLTNGTVFTTGINSDYGGLGNGTTNNYLYPVQVRTGQSTSSSGYLENIIEVATTGFVGYNDLHAFVALKSTGEVYSWGCSYYYTTGLGNTTNYSTPMKITALAGQSVVHIAAAVDHTGKDSRNTSALAVTTDGKTYTWGGKEGYYGHLGNGTTSTLHYTPKPTTASAFHLVTVAGGSLNYVGVKQDGSVWSWGVNKTGQIGIGTTSDVVPTATKAISRDLCPSVQVNDAAIYRGRAAAAAYGADAGAAGTQCPGELMKIIFALDKLFRVC